MSMASARLLRMSRPLGLGPSRDFSWTSTCSSMVSRSMAQMCLSKRGLSSKNLPTGGDERKVAVKTAGGSACEVSLGPKMEAGVVDLGLLAANVSDVILQWWIMITKQRPWKFNMIQMFIEKAIVDCRFFTLFAIGGSLLGSVICFFEGCFLILQSYLQYFHAISHASSQQGHVVQLLIEAIDVFLVGIAMLIFGVSLFVMFVGTKNLESSGSKHLRPSFFGDFNIKTISSRVGIQSVMQAKSKMGHAVIMILLVEVLEKFKSIPVVTGLDLACFAAAIFVSSASILLLSRLAVAGSGTSIE